MALWPRAIDRNRSQKADDQMGELTAKEKLIVERIMSHDQSGAQRAAINRFPFALALVACLAASRAAQTSDGLEMWYAISVGGLILSLMPASPDVGKIRPRSSLSVVVLPAPLGPSSPKISPRRTSRSSGLSAVFLLRPQKSR